MELNAVSKIEGVRLQAPTGATSVGYQGFTFNVEEDGSIVVPTGAVEHLEVHGYRAWVAPAPSEAIAKVQSTPPEAAKAESGEDSGEGAPTPAPTAFVPPWATK